MLENISQWVNLLTAILGVPIGGLFVAWRRERAGKKKAQAELETTRQSELKDLHDDINNMRDLLVMNDLTMLHDRIYELGSRYLKRPSKQITFSELENFQHLWQVYHAMNGNGTGELMVNAVFDMDIVDELQPEFSEVEAKAKKNVTTTNG